MKVVVGQGSCGIATGAKKTSNEFQRIIDEKNLTNVTLDKTCKSDILNRNLMV